MRNLMTWVLVGLCATPLLAYAAEGKLERVNVARVLATDESQYGGCMALISESPYEHGLDCPVGRWVTFDCAGEYVSKADASRMFDLAQMAFFTSRQVTLTVTDEMKHDRRCMAKRIDVLPTTAE